MALPSLAGLPELWVRLGSTAEPENWPQAQALLDYASALIRGYKHRTWVNDDGELEDVPPGVPLVCVEMVFRAIVNPEGATSEQTGPFSVAWGQDAALRVYLSKSDKTILGGRQTAFTIDTTPKAAQEHPLHGALVNGPDSWSPRCW